MKPTKLILFFAGITLVSLSALSYLVYSGWYFLKQPEGVGSQVNFTNMADQNKASEEVPEVRCLNRENSEYWCITAKGNNKEVHNKELGIKFEYPDPNNDIKMESTTNQYLALYRGENSWKEYYLSFDLEYRHESNKAYTEDDFENYVKGFTGGWVQVGTGAGMLSREEIDLMIKKAKISYRTFLNGNKVLLYEVSMNGLDYLNQKDGTKDILVYYPDDLNMIKENKYLCLSFAIYDVKDSDFYYNFIRSFRFED